MNYALIFAGGVGKRMNTKAIPKQFLEVHGKPIIIHTLEHFENYSEIDAICVVIVSDWMEYMKKLVDKFCLKKVKWIVPGEKTALESQYVGLKTIEHDVDNLKNSIVLIHDGVRPLIDEITIGKCIEGVKDFGSAITVAPAIETIIQVDNTNMITSTVPRAECQLARAPQAFYIDKIIKFHEKAREDGIYNFVDSTSLMLHYKQKMYTIEGPAENIKVTNPSDFYICRALLEARENTQIYGI